MSFVNESQPYESRMMTLYVWPNCGQIGAWHCGQKLRNPIDVIVCWHVWQSFMFTSDIALASISIST